MEISEKDNQWLVKLAGYVLTSHSLIKDGVHDEAYNWQPCEDYNQAVECLNSFLKKEDCEAQIEYDRTEWNVKIYREHMGAIKSAFVHGQNLSELIILCLLEARKRLA